MADVLRETIEAFLTETDPDEGIDSDDLAWALVSALRRARGRQGAASGPEFTRP